MKLSAEECDALCEYVDGRRAAGARYDVIANELQVYTVPERAGEEPRITEGELDGLEIWHRGWKRREVYKLRQQRAGDVRGGSRIAMETVDLAAVDAGEVRLAAAPEERMELTLEERADRLNVVMYLKKGLLKACWKWEYYKTIPLPDGVGYQLCEGPGRMVLPDGALAEWLESAVVLRRGDVVIGVFEDCRVRAERPAAWGLPVRSIRLERRELDGEKVDLRDLAARLAAVLHTCLGGAKSPFRNNEHLAQLLGVTREAMRVRRKRIMQDAGMQSAEGLVPGRAAGGRATQAARKIQNPKSKIQQERETNNTQRTNEGPIK